MTSELQQGRSLYYPNFCPDPNWLKCSLLYWDQVSRIVPVEAQADVVRDDPADCTVAEREGFLRSLDPREYRGGAGQQFRRKLEPLFHSKKPAHRNWLKSVQHQFRVPIHRAKVAHWLHDAKVPDAIRNELNNRGLLQIDGDWLAMPGMVAGIYMTCLATEMSSRTGIHLLMDQNVLSDATEAMMFSTASLPDNRDLVEERLVLLRLGIRFPKPENMEAVSMKKLLTFHQKYSDERRRFREVFDGFLGKIKTVDDPSHLNDVFDDERRIVSAAMLDHRRLLKELGVTGLWSFLRISVPSAFGLKLLENFAYTPALAVAGVAIGAAAALIDVRKQHAKLTAESPWHYAWKVARTFK